MSIGLSRVRRNEESNMELYHDGILEYHPMIAELAKRTKLPKFICRKIYDAETDILTDVGIIHDKEDVIKHTVGVSK